jgi:hypothetical protein
VCGTTPTDMRPQRSLGNNFSAFAVPRHCSAARQDQQQVSWPLLDGLLRIHNLAELAILPLKVPLADVDGALADPGNPSDLGAPLRNRTVDLLTMGNQQGPVIDAEPLTRQDTSSRELTLTLPAAAGCVLPHDLPHMIIRHRLSVLCPAGASSQFTPGLS